MTEPRYIPPAGIHALTPIYDVACRAPGLGERLRRFEIAALEDMCPRRILEVGCGTGELLRYAGARFSQAALAGVDPDVAALDRARRKLAEAGLTADLLEGRAESLPRCTDRSWSRIAPASRVKGRRRRERGPPTPTPRHAFGRSCAAPL